MIDSDEFVSVGPVVRLRSGRVWFGLEVGVEEDVIRLDMGFFHGLSDFVRGGEEVDSDVLDSGALVGSEKSEHLLWWRFP